MVIQKTLSFILARGLPGLISLLSIMVYTRLLPPEIYGQYAIIISLVVLTITMCYQWMQFAILRFYPKPTISKTSLLLNLLIVFVVISIFILPVFALVLQLSFDFVTTLIISLVILLTFLHAFFDMSVKLLVSSGEALYYGIILTAKAFIGLLIGTTLVYYGYSLIAPLIGLIIAYLSLNLLLIKKLWFQTYSLNIDKKLIKSMLSYGIPLTGTFLMDYIMSNSDRLMLAWLKGEESAGLYSAGYDVSSFSLMVIMMSVHYAIYPMIIKAYENNQNSLITKLIGQNLIVLLLAIVPLLIVLVYLVTPFSQIIFGQQFWQVTSEVIPVVTLATIFLGFKAFYFDLAFLIKQNTKPLLSIGLLGALINIALNYWLINQFDIIGAAYATCITYFIVMCISFLWGKKIIHYSFPGKDIFYVLVVLLITCFILYLSNLYGITNFFINIVILFFTYTLAVYSLNILDFRTIINNYIDIKLKSKKIS